jgi:hypothetical protein
MMILVSHAAAFGGPMAEWLRRGLQILARRFDSGSGLHWIMRAAADLGMPVRLSFAVAAFAFGPRLGPPLEMGF